MKAKKITMSSIASPTQYEIELEDGRMAYFRYRWGDLSISVSPNITTDIMDAVSGEEIYHRNVSENWWDGSLDENECLKHMRSAGIILDNIEEISET